MPTASHTAPTSSWEAKKRQGYEAALSPRGSPPRRAAMPSQERLPSIRNLLSDIPSPDEHRLSHLHHPARQAPIGPSRSAIPARLSPPPASRRSQNPSFSERPSVHTKNPRDLDRSSSGHSSYDGPSHRLPIHSGPPPIRTTYAPATLGPAPVSPYASSPSSSQDSRRGYSNGDSHSLPPPPIPYPNSMNGHAPSVSPNRDPRDRDSGYTGPSYRTVGPPSTYQPSRSAYPTPPYGYPPQPPHTNGNYAVHHQYQNGYNHGSVQFESDDSNGQAPRRRRGNLPRDTTDILKQWCSEHLGHPYPTEEEKQMLCRRTGLQMTQISNWFINARRRRIPELVNQATAETRLRKNSGESAGSSD